MSPIEECEDEEDEASLDGSVDMTEDDLLDAPNWQPSTADVQSDREDETDTSKKNS